LYFGEDMPRDIQFSFRANNDERRAIADLAVCLQRSQSDAVRYVVVAAARELLAKDQPTKPPWDSKVKPDK
jgi:hypothetical protein